MLGIPDPVLVPVVTGVIGFLVVMFSGAGILWLIIRSMGNNILRWTKALDDHEDQREKWRGTEQDLRTQIVSAEGRIEVVEEALRTEKVESQRMRGELQSQITSLSNEIAAANALIVSKDQQIEALNKKQTELETQNKALLNIQGQYATDRANWEAEKIKFERQRAEWVDERKRLDRERTELIERVTRLECTLEDVQKHGTGTLNPDVVNKAEPSQPSDVKKANK